MKDQTIKNDNLYVQTEDSPESRNILEGQLRECFGRVVYAHKTHEKAADILEQRLARMKFSQLALSAATTAGLVAAVSGLGIIGAIAGAFPSAVLLVINAYTKEQELGQLSQKHRQTGASLWLIREKYLSLITDLRMRQNPIEFIQNSRDQLMEDLYTVYASAPSTNSKAYQASQKALKYSEDMTFADSEIDAFLPKELKKRQDEIAKIDRSRS